MSVADKNIESFDAIEEGALYSAFYGKSEKYYLACLNKIKDGRRLVFSIYAFFFGVFWMAYRKMYTEMCIVLFISSILFFLFSIFSLPFIAINLGLIGNYLYIKKSMKAIDRVKEDYQSLTNRVDILRDEGGTSIVAPVILLIGLALLVFIYYSAWAYFLADPVFYH